MGDHDYDEGYADGLASRNERHRKELIARLARIRYSIEKEVRPLDIGRHLGAMEILLEELDVLTPGQKFDFRTVVDRSPITFRKIKRKETYSEMMLRVVDDFFDKHKNGGRNDGT